MISGIHGPKLIGPGPSGSVLVLAVRGSLNDIRSANEHQEPKMGGKKTLLFSSFPMILHVKNEKKIETLRFRSL